MLQRYKPPPPTLCTPLHIHIYPDPQRVLFPFSIDNRHRNCVRGANSEDQDPGHGQTGLYGQPQLPEDGRQ